MFVNLTKNIINNLLKIQHSRQFGVILFDNPELEDDNEGGWASALGAPSFRFARITDLSRDIIWINNASFEASRRLQHDTIHNFRGNSFLPASLKNILDDLVGNNPPSIDRATQQLSTIIHRIGHFCEEHYNEMVPMGDSLSSGIQDFLTEKKIESCDSWLDEALSSAYQKGVSCDQRSYSYMSNGQLVTLRSNRFLHAAKVLQTLIPEGKYEYLDSSKIPLTIDYILNQDRPVLARISVSKVNPEVSGILSFGSSTGGNRILREWASGPELILLLEHASIVIKGAVFWESAQRLPESMAYPVGMQDGMLAMSYSAGLVAESHLTALMSGRKHLANRSSFYYSPRAVFLSAADRLMTFSLAVALRKEGYQVMSYGMGAVIVRAVPSMFKNLSEFARDTGMSFPLPAIEHLPEHSHS